ncbi:MAG TPA: hypothetical protein VIL72_02430, partial [Beijerinckiaceae bacterium]
MNAAVKPLRTPVETALIERFEAAPALRDAARPAREAAIARFAASGLPHRRLEPWHYTDLRTLLKEAPPLGEAPGAACADEALGAGATFVFSGGRLVSQESGPGFAVAPLPADAELDMAPAPADEPVLSLARAFALDGLDISVTGAAALRLVFDDRGLGEAATSAVRLRVRVAAGAELTLAESCFSGDGRAHFSNVALRLELGEGARVRHVRLNAAGDQATALSTLSVDMAAGAFFETAALV